jgi:copper resistance protein B
MIGPVAPLRCLLAVLVFFAGAVQAQHHDHGADSDPSALVEDVDHSKMNHTKMDHTRMGHMSSPADAAQEPRTPIPPITEADRAAAQPPAHGHAHGGDAIGYLLFDRLEAWNDDGGGEAWEAQGWYGSDRHRLWLRSEGEREQGRTSHADLEVLYGRPIARWWDLVIGVRHDFAPGVGRDHAAIGVIGTAPYKFEVEATGYLDTSGRLSTRIEAEYELLLTNRLILQPTIEAEWHARDDRGRAIGAGVSTAEAGLRLRYEFNRRFAPYVGLVHERSFGATADLRRDEGDAVRDTRAVAGVRFWF